MHRGALVSWRHRAAPALYLLAACVSRPVPEMAPPQGEAAGRDQQRVRHYAYFNVQRHRTSEPWFLASASFDGAQLKYTWPELEPEKDRYDFSRSCWPRWGRIDGQVEGINLPETSLEFGTSGALFPSGFTPRTYREGVVDNIRALRRSFRASVAMQYANFMPGEWLPDTDNGYLKSVYAEARQLKLAMGGPDLLPLRRGQRNHTYAMLRAHRGVAPTGVAVQWGNYEEVDPQTGARITVAKLVKYASDTLGVQYIFWEPQEPFFGRDVLPFLQRTR